jgi:hypothetical protein
MNDKKLKVIKEAIILNEAINNLISVLKELAPDAVMTIMAYEPDGKEGGMNLFVTNDNPEAVETLLERIRKEMTDASKITDKVRSGELSADGTMMIGKDFDSVEPMFVKPNDGTVN